LIKLRILIVGVWALMTPLVTHAWNALGHEIVAQIAYDQLTPKMKRTLNRYNRSLDQIYLAQNWLKASVWLDNVRCLKNGTFNAMHYIDLGYSEDGTPLPSTPQLNAISAISESMKTLHQSRTSEIKKGIALRIILHVVGDIHQPLHATNKISRQFPSGDKGGNLVELASNSIAENLHSYWDNAGGYLMRTHGQKTTRQLKDKVRELESQYPCHTMMFVNNPFQWAQESHELGIKAHQLLHQNKVDRAYQLETIQVSKMRLAIAGCRLGTLLNTLDKQTAGI
jgi:hypothetical protein